LLKNLLRLERDDMMEVSKGLLTEESEY
jgi:hypothetical protein